MGVLDVNNHEFPLFLSRTDCASFQGADAKFRADFDYRKAAEFKRPMPDGRRSL
jgi:hypothetical protein